MYKSIMWYTMYTPKEKHFLPDPQKKVLSLMSAQGVEGVSGCIYCIGPRVYVVYVT